MTLVAHGGGPTPAGRCMESRSQGVRTDPALGRPEGPVLGRAAVRLGKGADAWNTGQMPIGLRYYRLSLRCGLAVLTLSFAGCSNESKKLDAGPPDRSSDDDGGGAAPPGPSPDGGTSTPPRSDPDDAGASPPRPKHADAGIPDIDAASLLTPGAVVDMAPTEGELTPAPGADAGGDARVAPEDDGSGFGSGSVCLHVDTGRRSYSLLGGVSAPEAGYEPVLRLLYREDEVLAFGYFPWQIEKAAPELEGGVLPLGTLVELVLSRDGASLVVALSADPEGVGVDGVSFD